MLKAGQSGGYTIVEVMIFLAVSSFMFVIAAFFIQNKQTDAQFTQAMNSINSSVQQVINDVNDNNYQNQNVNCTRSGNTITVNSGATTPTPGGCTLQGKVIQFGVGGTNNQSYNIYNIVDCQYSGCSNDTTSNPPSSLSDAYAQIGDTTGNCGIFTSCNDLEWGIHVTAMYDISSSASGASFDCPSSPYSTNSIGFLNSFAQQQVSGSGLTSGSQNIEVLDPGCGNTVGGTNDTSESDMKSQVNSYLDRSPSPEFITTPEFAVCFADGHGNIGLLNIGSKSGGLTTAIQISNSPISITSNYKCST